MSIIYILLTLLICTVLVVVHEAGHFAVAKLSGILVEEFSVGMGPIVFSKKIGETLYSVRAFPMGGFCRMAGEDEESSDSRSFNNKNVFARMAVVFTGPLMNFIFAFLAVFIVSSTAASMAFPAVGEVLSTSNAVNQGLEKGDKIVKIDNEKIHDYQELYSILSTSDGSDLSVTVKRNGEKVDLTITPVLNEAQTGYIIGFRPVVKTGLFAESAEGYDKATFADTVKDSIYTLVYFVKSVVVGFVRLFTLKLSASDVSGPIGIVQVVGDTVETGITYSIWSVAKSLLMLSALLSVNLGVINLFPIPAMDGGRLVFLVLEAIRRKPFNREKEGMVHFIGFILLILFMFLVASNDIFKIFSGR